MSERHRVAVVSTGRQDYGILRSTLVLLSRDPRFDLRLWAGGMHLRERFGRTIQRIVADGFRVDRELSFVAEPPDPAGDTARALECVSEALRADAVDALILVGDRTETLAAGLAAAIAGVPIVHVHGGEESEGAVDNACRHALTKLSHLHLVSHECHARRVIQMGEDPANVVVVGPPGVDNLVRPDLPDREQLSDELGKQLRDPVVVVTLHPVTLAANARPEVDAVATALARVPATYVVTQPNSDAGGVEIAAYWKTWAAGRDNVVLTEALGETRYWALLRLASAVVGNSSSGIIEAPAAGVPVVNVGDRQRGRLRFGRITDVPADARAIESALRAALAGATSPGSATQEAYPAPPAAPRVIKAIARWLPNRSVRKTFVSLQ